MPDDIQGRFCLENKITENNESSLHPLSKGPFLIEKNHPWIFYTFYFYKTFFLNKLSLFTAVQTLPYAIICLFVMSRGATCSSGPSV